MARLTPREFSAIVLKRYYLAEMSYTTSLSEPNITFDTYQAEDISVGYFSASNSGLRRSWQHVRRSLSNIHVLWFPIEARIEVSQDGQHGQVDSGGLLITAGDRAFTMKAFTTETATRTNLFHVVVPSHILRSFLPQVDKLCGRGFSVQSGSALMARSLFRDLFEQRQHLSERCAHALTLTGLDVISDAIRCEVSDETLYVSVQRRHFDNIVAYIRANFSRRGLTAEDVAEGCNISRRTLFNAMESQGHTYRGFLRRYRVERALAWRQDPDYAHCTTSDIAFMAGLCGPAELELGMTEHTATSLEGVARPQ